MGIRVAGVTHPGYENEINQDAVYAKTWFLPEYEAGVIAVADGMGGYANGEIAAQTAIEYLNEFFGKSFVGDCPDADSLSNSLDAFFLACHEKIKEINLASGGKSGTTLTVCVMLGAEYIVKNVGDTRCYVVSDGGLRQISTDDSWVAQQVRIGVLTEPEARKHKKQNLLTRCLGAGADVDPHTSVGALTKGQVLAVCSDGFYKLLEPGEITSAVAVWRDKGGNPLSFVLDTLFCRSETDNISLCLMC